MRVLQCVLVVDALLDAEHRRLSLAVERCSQWLGSPGFRWSVAPRGTLRIGERNKLGARQVAVRRVVVGYFGRLVHVSLRAAGLCAERIDAGASGRVRGGPRGLGCTRRVAPGSGGRGRLAGRHGVLAGGEDRVDRCQYNRLMLPTTNMVTTHGETQSD